MTIKINDKNAKKIAEELNSVFGKISNRVAYNNLLEVMVDAEKYLSKYPRAAVVGCRLIVCPPLGRLANSYRFRREYGTAELERRRGGWYLVSAVRGYQNPGQDGIDNVLVFSDAVKEIRAARAKAPVTL